MAPCGPTGSAHRSVDMSHHTEEMSSEELTTVIPHFSALWCPLPNPWKIAEILNLQKVSEEGCLLLLTIQRCRGDQDIEGKGPMRPDDLCSYVYPVVLSLHKVHNLNDQTWSESYFWECTLSCGIPTAKARAPCTPTGSASGHIFLQFDCADDCIF